MALEAPAGPVASAVTRSGRRPGFHSGAGAGGAGGEPRPREGEAACVPLGGGDRQPSIDERRAGLDIAPADQAAVHEKERLDAPVAGAPLERAVFGEERLLAGAVHADHRPVGPLVEEIAGEGSARGVARDAGKERVPARAPFERLGPPLPGPQTPPPPGGGRGGGE